MFHLQHAEDDSLASGDSSAHMFQIRYAEDSLVSGDHLQMYPSYNMLRVWMTYWPVETPC